MRFSVLKQKLLNFNQSQYIFITLFSAALLLSLFGGLFPIRDGGYAAQRVYLCGVSALFVLSGFIKLGQGKTANSARRTDLFIVLIMAIVFILFPYFFSTWFNFVEPMMFFTFFSAVVLGSYHFENEKKAVEVTVALAAISALGAFFYGGLATNVYIFLLFSGESRLDGYIPWGFVNIRYWSHLGTWLLPLFPLALLTGPLKNIRLWRILVFVGASLWIWLILLSSARATSLSVVFGTCVGVALFRRAAVPYLRSAVALWGGGIVLWIVLSVVLPSLIMGNFETRGISLGDSGRLNLWKEALIMSGKEFPLGMGPQSWLTHDILTAKYLESRKFGHPHNTYLFLAAEYGWIAVLALIFAGVVTIKRLLASSLYLGNYQELSGNATLLALTASVFAGFLHAGVSAVFMAPASMLVGLFVLMALWGVTRPRSAEVLRSVPKTLSRLVKSSFVVILAVNLMLWAEEVETYHSRMASDQDFYLESIPLGLMPRFWLHGNYPRHPELMR